LKSYDLDRIKDSLEQLKEMAEELRAVIRTNPAHYGRITGHSRQALHAFINNKLHFKTDKLIAIYQAIQNDNS
jgi:hypothetical protein